jgi:hypothetical protein
MGTGPLGLSRVHHHCPTAHAPLAIEFSLLASLKKLVGRHRWNRSANALSMASRPLNTPSGSTKSASCVKSAAKAAASLLVNASATFILSKLNSSNALTSSARLPERAKARTARAGELNRTTAMKRSNKSFCLLPAWALLVGYEIFDMAGRGDHCETILARIVALGS